MKTLEPILAHEKENSQLPTGNYRRHVSGTQKTTPTTPPAPHLDGVATHVGRCRALGHDLPPPVRQSVRNLLLDTRVILRNGIAQDSLSLSILAACTEHYKERGYSGSK